MSAVLNLQLAPLDTVDMGLVRLWRNDYRVWKWCRQNDLISDAEQMRWFNRQSEDPTIKMYKFVAQTPDAVGPVGVGGFTSIDMTNRRAEFSLYVAPDVQGKGLGTKALHLLFTHGFENLGFNLIWGESFDGNPAVKVFERLGMRHEGIRRSFYFRDGKYIDAHLYSLLKEEFNPCLTLSSGTPSSLSA